MRRSFFLTSAFMIIFLAEAGFIAWPFFDLSNARREIAPLQRMAGSVNSVSSSDLPEALQKYQPTADNNFSAVGLELTVPDQIPGPVIRIGPIHVRVPVWVVIYEDQDGFLGRPIGHVFFPNSDLAQSGAGGLETPLVAGQTYFAALHGDNG
ncbi:MAG TPA: hypothetical protein VMC43_00590, partial [Candidatus Paceibacterota bacterium]|nr:hypothetical protein [Candidatus Paceibacterota bacterium]